MERDTEERELANRFAAYGDAVAAVAFVNVLAFSIGVADQEIRCSLMDVRGLVVVCGIFLHGAYAAAIVVFHRGELRLRKAAGVESSEIVSSLRGRLYLARVAFVGVITLIFVMVAWWGIQDSSCPV